MVWIRYFCFHSNISSTFFFRLNNCLGLQWNYFIIDLFVSLSHKNVHEQMKIEKKCTNTHTKWKKKELLVSNSIPAAPILSVPLKKKKRIPFQLNYASWNGEGLFSLNHMLLPLFFRLRTIQNILWWRKHIDPNPDKRQQQEKKNGPISNYRMTQIRTKKKPKSRIRIWLSRATNFN